MSNDTNLQLAALDLWLSSGGGDDSATSSPFDDSGDFFERFIEATELQKCGVEPLEPLRIPSAVELPLAKGTTCAVAETGIPNSRRECGTWVIEHGPDGQVTKAYDSSEVKYPETAFARHAQLGPTLERARPIEGAKLATATDMAKSFDRLCGATLVDDGVGSVFDSFKR